MQFWATATPNVLPSAVVSADGSFLTDTPAYVEYGFPLDMVFSDAFEDARMLVYWMRLSEFDYFLATCWKNYFDEVDSYCFDPKFGPGVQLSVQQGWPQYFQYRCNGEAGVGQYRLLQMLDPDDSNPVWLLGCMLGNVQIREVPDLFSGRSGEQFLRLLSSTAGLLDEVGQANVLDLPNIVENVRASVSQKEWQQMVDAISGSWIVRETVGSSIRKWLLG